MKDHYDVTTPIELFFQQIQECIDFASVAQSPLTAEKILELAFLTLQRTGMFNTECRKWQKQPSIIKTCDNSCTFFKETHSDYLKDQDMTAQ